MATLTLIGALVLKATAIYGGSVVMAYYGSNLIGTDMFDISGSALRLAALGTLIVGHLDGYSAHDHAVLQCWCRVCRRGVSGLPVRVRWPVASGQAKGLGGGAGLPGLAQSQQGNMAGGQSGGTNQGTEAPGQTGGARTLQQAESAGNSNNAVYNAKSAIGRFNSEALEQSSTQGAGAVNGYAGMSGTRGLANDSAYSGLQPAGLQSVQQRQFAMEQADEMRPDPVTGVYRTQDSDAALDSDPALGRGGHLAVADGGSQGSTPTHAAPGSAAPAQQYAQARPGLNYGQARNDNTGVA